MVTHDLRVAARGRPGYHIVHHVGKGQGQVVGLSLAQHLGEVALGVCDQQQDFFALQRKTGPQVVAVVLLPTPPFWFATLITFVFAIGSFPPSHKFSRPW